MTRTERNALAAQPFRPARITTPVRTVGDNPALRRATPVKGAIGPVRRARHYSGAAAMRSGDGSGTSLWAASAEVGGRLRPIIVDSRWSATVNG